MRIALLVAIGCVVAVAFLAMATPKTARSPERSKEVEFCDPSAPNSQEIAALRQQIENARQRKERLLVELSKTKVGVTPTGIPPGAIPFKPADMGQLAIDGLKSGIEQDYRMLISGLGITRRQADELIELVAAFRIQKITRNEFDTALAGRFSPEQSLEVQSALNAPLAWAKTQDFDERLRYSGMVLNESQRRSLIGEFAAETQPLPLPRDDASVVAAMVSKKASNARVVERASGFLDSRQLKLLALQLTEELAFQEVGLLKMKKDLTTQGGKNSSPSK